MATGTQRLRRAMAPSPLAGSRKARAGMRRWALPFNSWGDGFGRVDAYQAGQALQLSAVFAPANMAASVLASSELRIMVKQISDKRWVQKDRRLPAWGDPDRQANPWQQHWEWKHAFAWNRLIGGNAYIYMMANGSNGLPTYFYVPPAGYVSGRVSDRQQIGDQLRGGIRYYLYTDASGVGTPQEFDMEAYTAENRDGKMLHTKWVQGGDITRSPSPLEICAPSLRIAVKAEEHAELFYDQSAPPGMIGTKLPLEKAEIERFIQHYKDIRKNPENRHIPFLMSGDARWMAMMMSPDELQLIDLRKFSVQEAGRIYGMPDALLNSSDQTTWGTGMEVMVGTWRQLSLGPVRKQMEEALTLLCDDNEKVVIDTSAIGTTTPKSQAESDALDIKSGAVLVTEVRERRGLPPREDTCPQCGNTPDGGGDELDEGSMRIMDRTE